MRIERLPGTANVIRFPIAARARPTLALLREITPDVREIAAIAETFELPLPGCEFRHQVDAETAEYILNQVEPAPGPRRTAALREILPPLLTAAVQGCRDASDAASAALDARQVLAFAKTRGGYWLDPLQERAERLSRDAAKKLVLAHTRSEEAEGAARAVQLALAGETWTPFDLHAEAELLFFGAGHSAAG